MPSNHAQPQANALRSMRVVLDTNVFLPMEDTNQVLNDRLARIKQLAADLSIIFLLHPEQINHDLNNDRNELRKQIIRSRSAQYKLIERPPTWDQSFIDTYPWLQKTGNDFVDNSLLCAIQYNAVHLLVTEDKAIHGKAIKLGIQDRVYYIDAFLDFLLRESPLEIEHQVPVGIQLSNVHNFNVNNGFFDSIRASYDNFNDWFKKISLEQRECWFVGNTAQIGAMVIFKVEENETVTNNGHLLKGRALKLCTFKVEAESRGRKIGERLLYTAFRYAADRKIDWVYLTLDASHHQLETLCQDFGFKNIGLDINSRRDHVWCKAMSAPAEHSTLPDFDFAVDYYPQYRKETDSSIWLVPIRPEYHSLLFPDQLERDRSEYLPGFLDNHTLYRPCSNTIKKAYLCHSSVKKIRRGDLIYFYCSQNQQKVFCVCIVEQSIRSSSPKKIWSLIAKRTVYSQHEVTELSQRETLVILFRLLEYLPEPISRQKLEQMGITGNIQSIRSLEHVLS